MEDSDKNKVINGSGRILTAKFPDENEFANRLDYELYKTLKNIIKISELAVEATDYTIKTDFLNQVIDSSKSLEYIVEAIKKSFVLKHVSLFNLSDMLNSIERISKPEAEKRGLTLKINKQNDLPESVLGNDSQITQILMKIIKNSADYTSVGGITVNVEEHKKSEDGIVLLFSISDTGIGMSADEVKNLLPQTFEEKRNNATYNNFNIESCRALVDMMGGELRIESILGKGTTVSFTVPCKIPKRDKENKLYKVLIVDDDDVILTVSYEILKRNNFTPTTAEGGAEAIEILKNEPGFDVILMDIYMPDMDGLTTSKLIREIEGYENTPIIALTANTFSGDREVCISSGMNDFITKPYAAFDFVNTVRSWAEK